MSHDAETIFPAFSTPKKREACLNVFKQEALMATLRGFLASMDFDASSSLLDVFYGGRILVNEQKHLRKRKDAPEMDLVFTECIQRILTTFIITCDRDHKAKEFHYTQKEIRQFEEAIELFDTVASWCRTIDVINAVFRAEDRRSAPDQSVYSLMLMGERHYPLTKQWTRKNGPEDIGLEVKKC